ncbi:MAG: ACT domain-containing protein [Pseudomonadota bacterium]
MAAGVSDLTVLLRTLEPVLHEGVYVYSMVPAGADLGAIAAIATFREAEGTTVILPEPEALKARLPVLFRAAWITLKVHSDLQAVGLTAAFSRALSEAGISCNVVAAACHDHIFVPIERAGEAMQRLEALQKAAS